jgi:hypothetical protein
MTVDSLTAVRELNSRINQGIQVRLLWHQPDERLWVTVSDLRDGDSFSIEVGDRTRALDVFHHPYAYVTDRAAV